MDGSFTSDSYCYFVDFSQDRYIASPSQPLSILAQRLQRVLT